MNKSLFLGLKKFGMQDIINQEIEIEAKKQSEKIVEQSVLDQNISQENKKLDINKYIYAKKFHCPCCAFDFASYVVKEKRLKFEGLDFDLRPLYIPINPFFYDIVICPLCGYSSLKDYFNSLTEPQKKAIQFKISPTFKYNESPLELCTSSALDRYNMALLNCMVKKGTNGERAYILMKIMWIYSIKGDLKSQKTFATLTIKYFKTALEKELLPIMGIGGDTLNYIIGTLYMFLGNKDVGLRYISSVILSKTSSRLKIMAQNIKDGIMKIT